MDHHRVQFMRYEAIEITTSNLPVSADGHALFAELDHTRRAERIKVRSQMTLEFVRVGGH